MAEETRLVRVEERLKIKIGRKIRLHGRAVDDACACGAFRVATDPAGPRSGTRIANGLLRARSGCHLIRLPRPSCPPFMRSARHGQANERAIVHRRHVSARIRRTAHGDIFLRAEFVPVIDAYILDSHASLSSYVCVRVCMCIRMRSCVGVCAGSCVDQACVCVYTCVRVARAYLLYDCTMRKSYDRERTYRKLRRP